MVTDPQKWLTRAAGHENHTGGQKALGTWQPALGHEVGASGPDERVLATKACADLTAEVRVETNSGTERNPRTLRRPCTRIAGPLGDQPEGFREQTAVLGG